jgi:hypothetical protein
MQRAFIEAARTPERDALRRSNVLQCYGALFLCYNENREQIRVLAAFVTVLRIFGPKPIRKEMCILNGLHLSPTSIFSATL